MFIPIHADVFSIRDKVISSYLHVSVVKGTVYRYAV